MPVDAHSSVARMACIAVNGMAPFRGGIIGATGRISLDSRLLAAAPHETPHKLPSPTTALDGRTLHDARMCIHKSGCLLRLSPQRSKLSLFQAHLAVCVSAE